MNLLNRAARAAGLTCLLALGGAGPVIQSQARLLDDFGDGARTGWEDGTAFGTSLPVETGGQLRFEQPPAPPIGMFAGTRMLSEPVQLKEGRTVELRVHLVQGGGQDSFAVLAFLPEANAISTLAGYGLAKSTTDILLTKGINKYFTDEVPPEVVKQDNVTLVLTLTVRDGSVHIRGRVLDNDAGGAIIYEREVIDTPAADPLRRGTDSPAAPFLGTGHFSLYLYQAYDASAVEEPYRAIYDNPEVFVADREVIDDFNDNIKSPSWEDSNFGAPFGLPVEAGGQFQFEQPPAGQNFFSGSRNTSKRLQLNDGERLHLEVDLIQGGAKDSFAVMGFIPESTGTESLAGYGVAKSTTDFLLSKSSTGYFFNEDLRPPVIQDNVRLGLILTAREGRVEIESEVRELETGALLYRQTALDTPEADVMADGQDSPMAPYLTTGYYTLFLFQEFDASAPEDPYRAYFDNAVVHAAPPPPNAAPVISDIQPLRYANFQPVTTTVQFKVSDDQPIDPLLISVTLNGVVYTTANGLTVTGTGNTRTVSLAGVFAANQNYEGSLRAADAGGEAVTPPLSFDTFAPNTLVVEVEDYNFDGGAFIDAPVPIQEGAGPQANAYGGQTGILDIDYVETRGSPNGQDTLYRPNDAIRMQRSFDYGRPVFINAGGAAADIYDHDVGDFVEQEWMNYTRTFPAGSYEVYLRQSQVNQINSECALERVTSDPTSPEQQTTVLGSFLGVTTGFLYNNTALTDGTGQNKITLRLSGRTTLRLRQITSTPSDSLRAQNYLAFVQVSDVGPQAPLVASLSPAPGSTVETVTPEVRAEIQNRDTTVVANSVVLRIGGVAVAATVLPTATGATVEYDYPAASLPAAGSVQNAQLSFRDSANTEVSSEWSFTITYKSLKAENRATVPGGDPGFLLRVVQAPPGSNLENSLQRAEDQLRANSPYTAELDLSTEADLINFSQSEGGGGGHIGDNLMVPGIDGTLGTDDFVVEVRCWLSLNKGVYRFGVVTDDGFKLQSGTGLSDISAAPLDFHNGGPADKTFDFVVPEAGLYPFRWLWYERGGDAHGEWFAQDITTGERVLINDRATGGAVAAFRNLGGSGVPVVEASLSLASASWAVAADAVVNAAARTVTVPIAGNLRFIRLANPMVGGAEPVITSMAVQGGALVISYTLP